MATSLPTVGVKAEVVGYSTFMSNIGNMNRAIAALGNSANNLNSLNTTFANLNTAIKPVDKQLTKLANTLNNVATNATNATNSLNQLFNSLTNLASNSTNASNNVRGLNNNLGRTVSSSATASSSLSGVGNATSMASANISTAMASASVSVTTFSSTSQSVLSGISSGLSSAGSAFMGLGNQILDFGQTLAMVAGGGVAAFTLAMAGLAASSTKTAMDFEQGMADIAAIMGLTVEQVKPLQDLSLGLSLDPNLKVSATEAQVVIQNLGASGVSTEVLLKGAAKAVVEMQNSLGGSFETSANVAVSAMQMFNIEAEKLNTVTDAVTNAAQKSKFGIDDFNLALSQGGGVASMAGVKLDEFLTVITAISPAFSSGSDAGTSLKTAIMRLVNPTDESLNAMQQLGVQVIRTKDGHLDLMKTMEQFNGIVGKTTTSTQTISGLTAEQIKQQKIWQKGLEKTNQELLDYEMGINGVRESEEKKAQRIDQLKREQQKYTDALAQFNNVQDKTVTLTKTITQEEADKAMATIFGSDAIRAGTFAGKLSYEQMLELNKEINKQGTAAQAAATRMNTLKGAFEILSGSIEGLQIKVGSVLAPILRNFVVFGNDLVGILATKLPNAVEMSVSAFGALFGGLNLFDTQALSKQFKSMLTVLNPAKLVEQMSLGAVNVKQGFDLSKLINTGDGNTFSVALSEQGQKLVDNLSAIAAKIGGLFGMDKIKGLSELGTSVLPMINYGLEIIIKNFDTIVTIGQGVGIFAILATGAAALAATLALLTSPLTILVGGVTALALAWQTNFLGIQDSVAKASQALNEFYLKIQDEGVWNTLKNLDWNSIFAEMSKFWEGLVVVITNGLNQLPALISSYVNSPEFSEGLGSVMRGVGYALGWAFWNGLDMVFKVEPTNVKDSAGNTVNQIGLGIVGELVKAIGYAAVNVTAQLVALGVQMAVNIAAGFIQGLTGIQIEPMNFAQLIDLIFVRTPAITTLIFEKAKLVAYDLIDGLKKGLAEQFGAENNAFTQPILDMIATIKSVLGIASPSTVFAQIGMDMVMGLANGITENFGLVTSLVSGLFDFSSFFGGGGDTGEQTGAVAGGGFSFDILTTALSGVTTALDTFKVAWGTFFTDLISGLTSNLPVLEDGFKSFYTNVMASQTNNQLIITNKFTTFLNTLKNSLTTELTNINNEIKTKLDGFITAFDEAMKTILDTVETKMSELFDTITRSLENIVEKGAAWAFEKFAYIGEQIINGMIKGLEQQDSALYSAINDIIREALKRAKTTAGIASPSKVFAAQVGKPISQGIAVGIEKTGNKDVLNAVNEVINNSAINSSLEAFGVKSSLSEGMVGKISQGVQKSMEANTLDRWGKIEVRNVARAVTGNFGLKTKKYEKTLPSLIKYLSAGGAGEALNMLNPKYRKKKDEEMQREIDNLASDLEKEFGGQTGLLDTSMFANMGFNDEVLASAIEQVNQTIIQQNTDLLANSLSGFFGGATQGELTLENLSKQAGGDTALLEQLSLINGFNVQLDQLQIAVDKFNMGKVEGEFSGVTSEIRSLLPLLEKMGGGAQVSLESLGAVGLAGTSSVLSQLSKETGSQVQLSELNKAIEVFNKSKSASGLSGTQAKKVELSDLDKAMLAFGQQFGTLNEKALMSAMFAKPGEDSMLSALGLQGFGLETTMADVSASLAKLRALSGNDTVSQTTMQTSLSSGLGGAVGGVMANVGGLGDFIQPALGYLQSISQSLNIAVNHLSMLVANTKASMGGAIPVQTAASIFNTNSNSTTTINNNNVFNQYIDGSNGNIDNNAILDKSRQLLQMGVAVA